MRTFHLGTLALLIVAAGCGGSGSRPFYSSHTSTNGSNGAPQTAKYATPALVAQSHTAVIEAVSPNGHLVGFDFIQNQAVYWDTPTSTPVPLQTSQSQVIATSVNNAGQVVGFVNVANGFVPLYWANPNATAVALAIPSGEPDARAMSINASGQIVGMSNDDPNIQSIYWSSPSATPQVLNGVGGGSPRGQMALRISNDGHMFGITQEGIALVWSSPSGNPTALPIPHSTYFIGYSNQELAMNPETSEAGGGAQGTTLVPVFWGANEALISPPAPTGDTDPVVLLGIGPNHQSVGIAGTTNSVGVIWTTPTTPFKDLNTLIPSSTGWSLESAAFMLDDGSIIGQGTGPANQSGWYLIHPNI